MRKKKGRYHHGSLRESILQTAIAIADEEGAEAVTTRAIARRLGVSHNAPARHFPTRTDLLAEVAAVAFEMFTSALSRASMDEDAETAMAEMGRAYVRFALAHPGLLHLMFSREIATADALPARLKSSSESAYEVLQRGVARTLGPKARPNDVAAAAFYAWACVHGMALLWLNGPMHNFFASKAQFLSLSDKTVRFASQSMHLLSRKT